MEDTGVVMVSEPFLSSSNDAVSAGSACLLEESQPRVAATEYEQGWTPVREEEYFRLPDWCIELCEAQNVGKIPTCTPDELANATDAYFSAIEPTWIKEETEKMVDEAMNVDHE